MFLLVCLMNLRLTTRKLVYSGLEACIYRVIVEHLYNFKSAKRKSLLNCNNQLAIIMFTKGRIFFFSIDYKRAVILLI